MKVKEIINLPVFTQSGQFLGLVKDFEIDQNSQEITRYIIRIKKNTLLNTFLKNELVIARSQVVSLSQEKMIVEDNFEKEVDLWLEKKSSVI